MTARRITVKINRNHLVLETANIKHCFIWYYIVFKNSNAIIVLSTKMYIQNRPKKEYQLIRNKVEIDLMNDIRVLNFYQMIFIFPIKSSTGSTVTFALFNVYRHSCYIFINTSLLCLNTNFGKYPLRYREYFPLQKVFCVL